MSTKTVKRKFPQVKRSLEWFVSRIGKTIWRWSNVDGDLQKWFITIESTAQCRALFDAQHSYNRFYYEV